MFYLGNLLHICNHLIIALCLFAQPGKKRLAMNGLAFRTDDSGCLVGIYLSRYKVMEVSAKSSLEMVGR